MNLEQAKANLVAFLGNRELTFSIKHFPDGEWIAECIEIPAIMTGGKEDDITNVDSMIRDAILTAAGIDQEFSNQILKFKGYRELKPNPIANLFSSQETGEKAEADYVLA